MKIARVAAAKEVVTEVEASAEAEAAVGGAAALLLLTVGATT